MVPARLQVFRAVQDLPGPRHISEVAAATGLPAAQVASRLAELATGKWPALQIQRVMNGVYQRIPE